MKLTTKGRYAVTAMLDLALHHERGAVSLAEVAARQGLSLSYLEQLFARLRREGLVESSRGPGGGYRLASNPDQISVARIIDAIDEQIDATRCGGDMNCDGNDRCLTHDLWESLSDNIRTFLDRVSLGELARQPHIQQVARRQAGRARVVLAPLEWPIHAKSDASAP